MHQHPVKLRPLAVSGSEPLIRLSGLPNVREIVTDRKAAVRLSDAVASRTWRAIVMRATADRFHSCDYRVAFACRCIVLMFGLLAINAGNPAVAAKVAGVTLDESIVHENDTLVLNGAGLRKRLFFKLYVGSLYLEESLSLAGQNAQLLVEADAPMLIQLNILSDLLTRDKMINALNEGFKKSTGGNLAPIQDQIDMMIEAFDQPIRPGEVYQIAYHPDRGTSVLRAEQTLATSPGLPFKQAVFGIWLSDSPAQASLKSAMLGK